MRSATQRLLDLLPASDAGRAKPAADGMLASGAAAKAAGNAVLRRELERAPLALGAERRDAALLRYHPP